MTAEALDLRLVPAALAAWGLTALGLGWSTGQAVLGAFVLLTAGVVLTRVASRDRARDGGARRQSGSGMVAALALVVGAGALGVSGLRAGTVQAGPVPGLALQRAQVQVAGIVVGDPVRRDGQFAPYVLLRVDATEVMGRGALTDVRSPLLVIADLSWLGVRLGDHIAASGRLGPAQGRDLAGVLFGDPGPEVTQHAGRVHEGIGAVRDGVREAAAPLPIAERSLVPALVDGDDAEMPDDVRGDFQTTGLTHLLAVSGSNLTLVLGFMLFVARWCGVRARGIAVVGLVSVVFFVLLARPEPSVLRAAAMGVVALAGLSAGGRRRGLRTLCVAVTVLVLLDPWLSRSVGFLLSTLATGGILLLAPRWREALASWMPRMLAEAIAVPMSAQIVCTPAIAAISGQVSLVAIVSNLLAAPAVGPTTVIGLVAGLAAVVDERLGHVGGHLAGLPAWWIVTVAQRTARLAGASLAWPVGILAIAALTIVCAAVIVTLPRLLAHRRLFLAVAVLLLAMVVHPFGRIGWPPHGWVLVMCDVGQGDGMVLNAGHGVAVVVDTGPDPVLMDGCLDELGTTTIALVVLTHFHADHVDGLPGVLRGRDVKEIEVSPLPMPSDRRHAVTAWAAAAHIPVSTAVPGERRRIGALSWTVLGPSTMSPSETSAASSEEGSGPNNASIVMELRTGGHELLLTGDAEPEEQDDVIASGADLTTDVLKVPHHGSANQDPHFVEDTHAPIAVISVGAGNDYGHPSPETLAVLRQLGAHVYRTDRDGDIAIVERAGQLAVLTSKG